MKKKADYMRDKVFPEARGLAIHIQDMMEDISDDIDKYWRHGNTKAGKRARVNSVKLEKRMKQYRLMTIAIDKSWKWGV